jgi:hypothetical protein
VPKKAGGGFEPTNAVYCFNMWITKLLCKKLDLTSMEDSSISARYNFDAFDEALSLSCYRISRALHAFLKDGRLTQVFQVEKIRGLTIDNQLIPYDISTKGVEVHPSATVCR